MASDEVWSEEVDVETTSPRRGVVFSALAVATLGFIMAAALIRSGLPADGIALYAPDRSAKRALGGPGDGARITAVSFGSSHVHQSLVPSLWDKSFGGGRMLNLAVKGGSQTEQRRMAFDHLHRSGATPCLILFEFSAGLNFPSNVIQSARVINIYDPDTIDFVLSYGGVSGLRRAGRWGFALAAGVENAVNMGMLANRLFGNTADSVKAPIGNADTTRGYMPAPMEAANLKAVTVAFKDVGRHRPDSSLPAPLAPGVARLAREVFARGPTGAQIVYVEMPLVADIASGPAIPPGFSVGKHAVPIVDGRDVATFPMLTDFRNWADPGHLSDRGARSFTPVLARIVAGRIDRPLYQRCEAAHAVH